MSDTNANQQTPGCLAARDWMARYYDDVILPLRYYSDKEVPRRGVPGFDSAEDARCVSHVRGCAECFGWMRDVAGERVMERQHRLAQYCCGQMFSAVEKPKTSCRLQLGYDYKAEAQRRYLNAGVTINYCPWCGSLLPNGPFVRP
jgi:hypothetical protein